MASGLKPPPYSEVPFTGWHHRDDERTNQFGIRRKPLSRPSTAAGPSFEGQEVGTTYVSRDPVDAEAERLKNINLGKAPPNLVPPVPDVRPKTPPRPKTSDSRLEPRTTASTASTARYQQSAGNSSSSTANSSQSSFQSSALSFAQKAYREARHFAGGLIQHPTESTKHFTILRHSHGLVFYQGTKTSVSITILGDRPLPPDRTIWLQNKGWTGKTGMRARTFFGYTDDWLNVTPTIAVGAEQVNKSDERAWQRDIATFRKRGPSRVRENHKPLETAVVRIPVEASDGYYQLVLCEGDKKKVLCRSPVFRVFSLSMDPSSIRGASLSTLPLELGAWLVGQVASLAVETVTETATTAVEAYLPSWFMQEAVSLAYDVSGAGDKIDEKLEKANMRYEQAREAMFAKAGGEEVNLERGPTAPYPICFVACCEPHTREYAGRPGMPTMNLSKLPDNVQHRLHGYYFGWVRSVIEKSNKTTTPADTMPWHQAVISALDVDASQLTRVNMARAIKRRISVRLLCDPDDPTLNSTRIEVQVMGFIRPDEPAQVSKMEKGIQAGDNAALEAAMIVEASDAAVAQGTLDHPAWSPDAQSHEGGQNGERGILDRTVDGFTNIRMKADNMPLHRLGVRTGTDELKDKAIAVKGFYIVR